MPVSRRQKDAIARFVYLLPLTARRHVLFVLFMKHIGHFRKPRTFNEKVNWRIIHDRRSQLIWTCDKLRVKEEAARHGIKSAKVFWTGRDVAGLAGVDLPPAWVLKPNHRSRCLYFGTGPVGPNDIDHLRRETAGWMSDLQGAGKGEWAYTQARHLLFVEELLGDGTPLVDYRLFTYDGVVHFVQVVHDINKVNLTAPVRRYYTGDWGPLEARQRIELGPILPRPATYDEMRRLAGEIGAPFDFARIDFYDLDGELYLGEVTPYPGGGLVACQPASFDVEMGAPWKLPELDGHGQSLA